MREDDGAERVRGAGNQGQLEVKPSLSPVVREIIQDILQLLFTSFLIKYTEFTLLRRFSPPRDTHSNALYA